MSTVKIKTEPTTAAAAAAVDVQVKLEPSLSADDIKLEQHTSDIDTKIEEDDFKSESDSDDSDEDTDQNQRQWKCDYPGCDRRFNSSSHIRMHQFDHMLEADINMKGKILILARESVDDQWPCPIPDCERLFRTAGAVRTHVRSRHGDTLKQQKPPSQFTRYKLYFIDVDHFYVNGNRCGYYTTIGVFICHDCRLVPECLLTHLQQKHGYDEKSIDSSALPGSAVNAGANPNINQHDSNPHLASAIRRPYQRHQQDIIQGWLCVTSDCGCCGYSSTDKCYHKRNFHQQEDLLFVPALVLRLLYAKTQALCFLITRISQASGAVTINRNRVNRRRVDYSHNEVDSQDENGDDTKQNVTTDTSNLKRQYVCDHDDCGRSFSSATHLSMHRREHKLEVVINIRGNAYTLSRQSVDDRWACPISDCESEYKTAASIRDHILCVHITSAKQKRANIEDDDSCQQNPVIKRRQRTWLYLKVDYFYVNGTKCGYHTTTGLFICHECKVVPECLFTHLQQKHGFDEKSIDSAFIPENARTSESDPNINQHVSNSHLASAIREPSQLPQHSDIIQGWLCMTSECGYCGYTVHTKYNHKKYTHQREQVTTVPALVLRLLYGKTQASYFHITRLDTTNSITKQFKLASQYKSECDEDEDDVKIVLSDYSDDEDDIH